MSNSSKFKEISSNADEVLSRHDKTQLAIKGCIASYIERYCGDHHDLLEVGAESASQTVFYAEALDRPVGKIVVYDWVDQRADNVKGQVDFRQVNLETERFPDEGESFGVVICSQVLEHLKNIYTPISEIWRVLRPGGYAIISVPNLSALHNCILLGLGQQPTTIAIAGSHVRGYGIWAMNRFLTKNGLFEIVEVAGIGLHPFTSARLFGPLKTYCHTPVWLCRKSSETGPTWEEERRSQHTTTNFFVD